MMNVLEIRKLSGGQFRLPNTNGSMATYQFPQTFMEGWPRKGLEGFAVPVTARIPGVGNVPSMLKAFIHDVPGRAQRLDSLVSHGLASTHPWLYSGVPYASVRDTVNGVAIDGHVSKHVCYDINGEDFGRLKNNDLFDGFDKEQRTWLAEQLCCAVIGLEKNGIVHGDLSHGNVIIGWDDTHERLECVIIDYDGFRASATQPLPRQHCGMLIRPLGTPGYQHPDLIRRMKADVGNSDESLFVENDRFALGVLCCELMVWRPAVKHALGRDELLPDDLKSGALTIPKELNDAWPEGARLLQEAVRAPTQADVPGPEAWLRVLGRPPLGGRPAKWPNNAKPRMRISKQTGSSSSRIRVKQVIEFGANSKSKGNFSKVDAELTRVNFHYIRMDGGFKLTLAFDWPERVFVTRDHRMLGVDDRHASRPVSFEVGPTDVIRSNGWRFDFEV